MKLTARTVGLWLLAASVCVGVVILALCWWARYLEHTTDKSLLTDVPCAAPCWQGIMPGVSTEVEVRQILETNPYVQGEIWEGHYEGWRVINWHPSRGRGITNHMLFRHGVAYLIRLGIVYDLTVEEILEKYGPPEAILVDVGGLPERAYTAIYLYYPSKGLEFTASAPLGELEIQPTTKVVWAVYCAPTSFDNSILFPEELAKDLQPWEGYGEVKIPER